MWLKHGGTAVIISCHTLGQSREFTNSISSCHIVSTSSCSEENVGEEVMGEPTKDRPKQPYTYSLLGVGFSLRPKDQILEFYHARVARRYW